MATEIYVNGERVTPDQIEAALARQEYKRKWRMAYWATVAIGAAVVIVSLLVAK